MLFRSRGQRVMLDSDLAHIYGVTAKRLNEQVSRNRKRFPADFMFQLSEEEAESLRSRFATSNKGRGGRRYLPYVFTEHGTVMLSAVLHTPVAIEASIQIARAFVRIRQMVASHHDLARRLHDLEKKYDGQFQEVFTAINELMEPPVKPKLEIGFKPHKK